MLAFLDFIILEKTGKPALELEYKAMQKGPVPREIYENRDIPYETECFKFVQTGPQNYIIEHKQEPDMDYFSKYEKETMEEIISRYTNKNVNQRELSKIICEDSHKEIKAWEVAWNKKENSIIDYDYVFGNIFCKPGSELSQAEITYLTYRSFAKKN
ncbi:MAG: Panacea domain-containing protein [Candidatus Humimicrobiaceae bacterium]